MSSRDKVADSILTANANMSEPMSSELFANEYTSSIFSLDKFREAAKPKINSIGLRRGVTSVAGSPDALSWIGVLSVRLMSAG
eukprot:2983495-Prymnesium_polylepis.1